MKRLFSFSVTSTFTFILSILAILVIAVSAPGMVQAALGPGASTASPDSQPGNSIMASSYYEPKVNPAANFGGLTDNGTAAYMGIGTNTPVSPLHIYSTSSTQPETIDLDGAQPITAQWNDYCPTGGAFSGSGFLARFARNTRASPANVQAGDRLGFNVFGGWAGTGFKHTAAIEAIVGAGTISDTSLPTYMKFSTTPDGSASRLERMRITPGGHVGIGTTDPTNGKLDVETSNGAVAAVYAMNSTSGNGVYGISDSGSGVRGQTNSGNGVYGSASGGANGVWGSSVDGWGVYGTSTTNQGVYGKNTSRNNYGFLGGYNHAVYGTSENQTGVWGGSTNGIGVWGVSTNNRGVYATSDSDSGVEGHSGSGQGVMGLSISSNGVYGSSSVSHGVYGTNASGNFGFLGDNNTGVYGYSASNSGKAGDFHGNVNVTDNLTLGGKAAIGTSSQPNSVLQVAGPIATAYRLINTGGVFPALETDSVIACDATGVGMITINLPVTSGKAGRAYTVKRLDVESGWVVQVNGAGSTIDGAAFYNLVGRWKYVTVVCDGANWLITANN